MYYSGFADESGSSIDVQIRATQELGWKWMESRSVSGVNTTDLPDDQFEMVCEKLDAAGIRINCFGSAIANWSTDPRCATDFENGLASLRRAIPRMQRLGTRYLRGMSFGIVRDAQPDSPEIEKQVIEKLRVMVSLCAEAEIYYLHENCMNFGGLSHEHTLRLLEAIPNPYFRLIFDTGNPVGSDRHIGNPPYRKQSAWEFYRNVREFIEYVHIKDCIFIAETGDLFPDLQFTWPGEGHGNVREIVADLLATGYDGGLSIEPHMKMVYHRPARTRSGFQEQASPEEVQSAMYVEYGRRLMNMVDELRKKAG